MRSEVESLPNSGGPQTSAHSPVDVSWHEWEPGHEGKAIVTDNNHVYSWSNGVWDAAGNQLENPNSRYMPHGQFVREHLGSDSLDHDWHYFEIDPSGLVVPDSDKRKRGFPEALDALQAHHPALDLSAARSAQPQWNL